MSFDASNAMSVPVFDTAPGITILLSLKRRACCTTSAADWRFDVRAAIGLSKLKKRSWIVCSRWGSLSGGVPGRVPWKI